MADKLTVPYKLKSLKLDKLKPHPKQKALREISDEALAGLSGSIDEFGLLEEIILNSRTGHILSGHQRWRVLQDQGHRAAPVKVIDVPKKTENAIFLNMNNPAICGTFTLDTRKYVESLKKSLGDAYEKVGLNLLEVTLSDLTDDSIPDNNKSIDEEAMKETEYECPSCGFKW